MGSLEKSVIQKNHGLRPASPLNRPNLNKLEASTALQHLQTQNIIQAEPHIYQIHQEKLVHSILIIICITLTSLENLKKYFNNYKT